MAQEVIGYLLAGAPLNRQQAGGGTAEVFGVTGDMKTDHITGQQAANDFFSPRKDAEHIGTGERRVVEKAHLHIRPLLADVARGQPQVVVVNPNAGTWRGFIASGFGKAPIHLLECGPVGVIDVEVAGKGVQDRPGRFLRGHVIEA